MKRLLIKTVSLLLLLVFFANTCCYGLATLPASQNPLIKREILAALQRTQIRYAESEDAIGLLNANNASCLLLSSGKYLVTKEVAQSDLKLLRAIIHEDIEAIMQILAKEDRHRYQAIKELILKYFPPPKDNKLPIELYVNHTAARAFEWLILLYDKIILEDEIPQAEKDFLKIFSSRVATRRNYFTGEFWDSRIRGEKIRLALADGMRFYQVASFSPMEENTDIEAIIQRPDDLLIEKPYLATEENLGLTLRMLGDDYQLTCINARRAIDSFLQVNKTSFTDANLACTLGMLKHKGRWGTQYLALDAIPLFLRANKESFTEANLKLVLDMLRDPDPSINKFRKFALDTIPLFIRANKVFATEANLNLALDMLRDPDQSVRKSALCTIPSFMHANKTLAIEENCRLVLNRLNDTGPYVRHSVLEVIPSFMYANKTLATEENCKLVLNRLNDTEPYVRQSALKAMPSFMHANRTLAMEGNLRLVLKKLNDKDEHVRSSTKTTLHSFLRANKASFTEANLKLVLNMLRYGRRSARSSTETALYSFLRANKASFTEANLKLVLDILRDSRKSLREFVPNIVSLFIRANKALSTKVVPAALKKERTSSISTNEGISYKEKLAKLCIDDALSAEEKFKLALDKLDYATSSQNIHASALAKEVIFSLVETNSALAIEKNMELSLNALRVHDMYRGHFFAVISLLIKTNNALATKENFKKFLISASIIHGDNEDLFLPAEDSDTISNVLRTIPFFIQANGTLATEENLKLILNALKDKVGLIRCDAITAIPSFIRSNYALATMENFKLILSMLKYQDLNVRLAAAEILPQFIWSNRTLATEENLRLTLDALTALRTSPEWRFHASILEAIPSFIQANNTLATEENLTLILDMLTDGIFIVRSCALKTIPSFIERNNTLATQENLALVLDMLTDMEPTDSVAREVARETKTPSVRESALKAITSFIQWNNALATGENLELIPDMLNDEDPSVRKAAQKAVSVFILADDKFATEKNKKAWISSKVSVYDTEKLGISKVVLEHLEGLYFEVITSLRNICVGSQQLVRAIILQRLLELEKAENLNEESMSKLKEEITNKTIPGIRVIESLYKDTQPIGVEMHVKSSEYAEKEQAAIREKTKLITDLPIPTALRPSEISGEHLEIRLHPGFLPITNLNILYYLRLGVIKPEHIQVIGEQKIFFFPRYHISIQDRLKSQTICLLAIGYNLGFSSISPDKLTERAVIPQSQDILGYPGAYDYVGVTYDIYTGTELECGQTNIFTQSTLGFLDKENDHIGLMYSKDLELNVYLATAILAYLREEESVLKNIYEEFRGKLKGCLGYLGLDSDAIGLILGNTYDYPKSHGFPYKFDAAYIIKAIMYLGQTIERSKREGKDLDPLKNLITNTIDKIQQVIFKDYLSRNIAQSLADAKIDIDDIIPSLIHSLYSDDQKDREKAKELLEIAGGELAQKALTPYRKNPPSSGKQDTSLSRGQISELGETHPALDKAANEGRMFAVTLDKVGMLHDMDNERLADLLIANLMHLRSPPEIRSKLLKRLEDAPTFRNNLITGFQMMRDAIKDQSLPQDKPTRLCIVIEDENLPTIVFKDPYNNLIAHSGKGQKTNTPYTSIYAGYNSLEIALLTNQESGFTGIITHEARDVIRGRHVDDTSEAAIKLYADVLDRGMRFYQVASNAEKRDSEIKNTSPPVHASAKEQLSRLSEGSTISSEAITVKRAKGVYLWDIYGKRYLDLFSQTWSLPLGHNNNKIIQAVRRQLGRITHLRTAYVTEEKTELARKIIALAPTGLNKMNFVLHGSLAVEGAMKLAMNYYEERQKILYLEDGFHGRSLATMGISWKIQGSKYSSYFTNGVEVKKDLNDIEKKMKDEKPAAIIIELVQGNAGCKILNKELVKGIRELCDKYGVVMIVDEVQTAFGCMGKMFLCDDYGVIPDILVFGKAIGGGFPLAGIIYKDKFSFKSGDHSFTFAHSPVSFAAGLAYLEELQPALKRVDLLNQQIGKSLCSLGDKYKNLRHARCIGVKGAIDVVDDAGKPDCKTADLIVSRMQEKGVIIANSRYRQLGNTLMIQPPIIITKKQLKSAFDILERVLNEIYPIKLGNDFKTGVLKPIVSDSFIRLGRLNCSDGRRVIHYKYNPKNEVNVKHNGVWYKFSFVPERVGEYDKPIPIDQISNLENIQTVDSHQVPEGRACPFCVPLEEEILCFLNMPSGIEYTIMVNFDPYGEEHMILASKEAMPQVLDEARANDLLAAARALGPEYEGSFTSLSGASILHFHGQFYRKKTPLWRNIEEGRIKIVNQQDAEGVIVGDLSGWPARARIVQGVSQEKVAKIVWNEIRSLISKNIQYNTKFLYTTDGSYRWVIAPRIHGFMTYAGYFLESGDAPEPASVSGCGSIESPGGDAVMFFAKPQNLTKTQKRLMASRFSDALHKTSNWSWVPPKHNPSPIKAHIPLWKNGKLNLRRPVQIVHRIESLVQANDALCKGAQVLEIDAQMTRDNVLVAFWGNVDATPEDNRTHIYEFTLSELETRLGKKMLKLDELFKLINGKTAINLDIKDWSDGIAGYREVILDGVINLVKKYNIVEDIFIESFNARYIEGLKSRAKMQSLEIAVGIEIPRNEEINLVLQNHINKAKVVDAQAVFIYPEKLTQESINAIHNQGLLVITNREGLDGALINKVDMLGDEYHRPSTANILDMSEEEVLKDTLPDIKDHSIRHAEIAVMIANALNLPEQQVEMVRRAAWAHDIGGFDKVEHPKQHKMLLRLEFVKCPGGGKYGAKPSFNPKLCIEHAKERIRQGLRGPLTDKEIRDLYPLYQEEFELLKGAPLTDTEKLVLRSWWYHALYSVKMLKNRNISLAPEIEALIRCNEQPWLIDTDLAMIELTKKFTLELSTVKRLLAILRASDILENGNNKYRKDLRGVPIEDFATTIKFMEYKFQIDGLQNYRDVIYALKQLFGKWDNGLLRNVISSDRQSSDLLPQDISFIQTQQLFDKVPLARDSSIKAVIFDWGNVISRFDWRLPAMEFARRFKIDEDTAAKLLAEEEDNPDHPLFRHERGMITEEQLTKEIKHILGLENAKITKQDFEEIFNSAWVNNTIGEAVSLIWALKEKGYKVFLLTTTNAINYRCLVGSSGLLNLLGLTEEDVFASHITGIAKPDMRSYKQVVDHAGVLLQQCLFVDNRKDNIDGAEKSSLKAVLFDSSKVGKSVETIITKLSDNASVQLQGLSPKLINELTAPHVMDVGSEDKQIKLAPAGVELGLKEKLRSAWSMLKKDKAEDAANILNGLKSGEEIIDFWHVTEPAKYISSAAKPLFGGRLETPLTTEGYSYLSGVVSRIHDIEEEFGIITYRDSLEQSSDAAFAVKELVTNIWKYAQEGFVIAQYIYDEHGAKKGFKIIAIDRGQGIEDVAKALEFGYSKSGSRGLGLPYLNRPNQIYIHNLKIDSSSNGGTMISVDVFEQSPFLPPIKSASQAPTEGCKSFPAGEERLQVTSPTKKGPVQAIDKSQVETEAIAIAPAAPDAKVVEVQTPDLDRERGIVTDFRETVIEQKKNLYGRSNVLDLYDTQLATVLLTDLIHAQLHEDKIYDIKYDTSRLSLSQIEIIEEYIRLLQVRSSNPENIRPRPFSSANGSKESLIAVYCTGKDFKGEGHVDISIPEGELKDYLLRIAGMINIALASSNIPDNLSKEDVDKYRPLMSYIRNQYKAILGEELTIPDSPEDILKVIRRIVLSLPKAMRMNTNQIEEYNKLAKEALIAA